jgi:hypothetical protein
MLSDFAREMNEFLDPGSTSPARLWARDVMRSQEKYIALNGDVFLTRTLPFGNGPFWGRRSGTYSINYASCDARVFELRLSEHYVRRYASACPY